MQVWVVAVVALLLGSPARAQALSPSTLERVDALLTPWDSYDRPGMAVGIVRGGELLWSKGCGMANLEHGIPNGPEIVYRIGSTSKQFTAACVALLALDGELDLASDIREHFPEFPERDPAITVLDLMHHTSGLPDYINIQFAAGGSPKAWFTPEQSLDVIAAAELEFAPGTRFSYSNSNYLLLGDLVRRVSGMTLREFARARIFEPLGMASTSFHDRHDQVVLGRSHGYSRQDEPGRGDWRVDITTLDHVGDGGVFTTLEDLALWIGNFAENRLGHGQELVELMHATGALDDGTQLDYAFGLFVREEGGRRVVSHGGSWVGYLAELVRYPDQDLAVIVLANQTSVDPVGLAREVARLCLSEIEAEQD